MRGTDRRGGRKRERDTESNAEKETETERACSVGQIQRVSAIFTYIH